MRQLPLFEAHVVRKTLVKSLPKISYQEDKTIILSAAQQG